MSIADGDTITVLDSKKVLHKVRVAGIDAPEKSQPFGGRSKQNMARMGFGQIAEIEWKKKDRYGRIVGKVLLPPEDCRGGNCPHSLDAGLAQIAAGLAWHYKKYEGEQQPADRLTYSETENRAQVKKIGLWSEPNPKAPWDYRRKK